MIHRDAVWMGIRVGLDDQKFALLRAYCEDTREARWAALDNIASDIAKRVTVQDERLCAATKKEPSTDG